jgi:LysR family transcriptional regulator, nod-box dependent transcriptional activator
MTSGPNDGMLNLKNMNLAQLDLNLLVSLNALLKERNVTRAGRRVGLSQPAMSAALGRLRELFQDDLLVRAGGGYRLTPLAVDLVEPLQNALALIERTVEKREGFDSQTARHRFRVAMSDYAMLVLGQPLLQRLKAVAPQIEIHIAALRGDLATRLKNRDIDLCIVPMGSMGGFPSQMLFRDRWICAVWKGHPDIGKRIDRNRFSKTPQVKHSVGRPSSDAERYLEAIGLDRNTKVTVESFLAAPFLLRGTCLLALLQERLAQRVESAAEIKLLEPPMKIPDLIIGMCWSEVDTDDAAHRWLRGQFAELASHL